jgi:putative acetyltransferase
MTIAIETANTAAQYEAGRALITAYAQSLGVDLEFQGFSAELATLEHMYGPPSGCLLLAREDLRYIGVVGLRALEPGIAEMKRLFVLDEHQGKGAGALLSARFLEKAKELGYRAVRLDSIRTQRKAVEMYRKLGFVEIEAYRYNPFPDAVYMEYTLV